MICVMVVREGATVSSAAKGSMIISRTWATAYEHDLIFDVCNSVWVDVLTPPAHEGPTPIPRVREIWEGDCPWGSWSRQHLPTGE